jgi:predicted NUDIX family NTP pyrophosphohydrolase
MKTSAGILLYRLTDGEPEVLLVHPGGPFFKNKDMGIWSIPKGEPDGSEDPKDTAIREFKEELGSEISGNMIALTPVIQKGGKVVSAWTVEGDLDIEDIVCNTFSIEWPPRSGKMQDFPEVDKAEWFNLNVARTKINVAQVGFIDELEGILGIK